MGDYLYRRRSRGIIGWHPTIVKKPDYSAHELLATYYRGVTCFGCPIMYSCTQVGPDIFHSAKISSLCSVEINVSPEVVFASLECAEDWPLWAPAIRKVEWTSPRPFGVGTTRTVTMPGLTGKEVFIAWRHPHRMAFCFSHASMPGIDLFAEDYQITPLDGDRSKLTWTVVIVPKGIGRISLGICSPFLPTFNQWMLNRLKKLLEVRMLS